MTKILMLFAVLIVIAALVIGGLFLFKGAEILQFGAEYGLKEIQSQVEQLTPEGFQADSLMLAFDQVIEKTKSGQLNTEGLKNILLWIPAQLTDGTLDSTEINNIITRLNKIVIEGTGRPQ